MNSSSAMGTPWFRVDVSSRIRTLTERPFSSTSPTTIIRLAYEVHTEDVVPLRHLCFSNLLL
jgi:hypothetical protein